MNEDKKIGITHSIREKLNFLDERLWKRFLARRLELIDTLDLSSKKASEQEDEIKKVAEILRLEFKYSQDYFPDFDKLVRAAVQSVRRNRKRSTKNRKGNAKKRRLSEDFHDHPEMSRDESVGESGGEGNNFLSEIARIQADSHDMIYDMNYPRSNHFTKQDHTRAAINSIIQPVNLESRSSHLGVLLPPLSSIPINQQQIDNEKELQAIRLSLLLLMKRLKLCLKLTNVPHNSYVHVLGQSAVSAISAMVFEKSFSGLNRTSVEYLQEKMTLPVFLARFYRSLEPESADCQALDDDTATTTFLTLTGCCIKDFGFNLVLYPIGEAFYRSILLEYPLVIKSSVPFLRTMLDCPEKIEKAEPTSSFGTPLNNLASVATELRSQSPKPTLSHSPKPHHTPEVEDKKHVRLTFLSSTLDFTYVVKNSAPPRLVEILENAKQAFKLNVNQIYNLRNSKSGAVINSDFDLEKLFAQESSISLEVFTQRFPAIPIYELTSAVTSNKYSDDSPKIILPPPIKNAPPPMLSSIQRPPVDYRSRAPVLPKFQPLL